MDLIYRNSALKELTKKLKNNPIVAILGPRQCGKTTLAKLFSRNQEPEKCHFFDLENPIDLAKLDNPLINLQDLDGYVIIDEVQRLPELFPILRVLADRNESNTKFILLGSASPLLIKNSSETLAGRVSFMELRGFGVKSFEQDEDKLDISKLWLRGGFPRSYLAEDIEVSKEWRENFIQTFLERDIPNLGISIPARTLRQFWTMLAHYHGQIFNASEIARSMNLSSPTIQKYLDILTNTYLIRLLQPWYYNTKKRLVKSPKLYFRDSGLFHSFLNIKEEQDLKGHPKLGASWEGFALEEFIEQNKLLSHQCFFWATHSGAELDLLFEKEAKLFGLEVKYADAPKLTKSMKSALAELNLEKLYVLYPGQENYKLDTNVEVIGLKNL
ncbi:MAG: ATP-binding protein [Candidatus Caenarcaniphilales bacterium]|nr:ATP-binding protein [Candidatus Caenarcaniphilales bacterium]